MSAVKGTLEELTTKAKIGLVVVSASTVSELRYPRAAPDVGFLASRMLLGGDQGLEALLEMERNSSRAVQELASAGVDSIAYCCTVSGAQRGPGEGSEVLRGDGAGVRHSPTTSTMLAAAEALQHLGIRKVVLTSPYPHSYHEAESKLLGRGGDRNGGSFRHGIQLLLRSLLPFRTGRNLPVLAASVGTERQRGGRAVHKLHELRRNGGSAGAGGCHREAGGDLALGDVVAGAGAGGGRREPVYGYGRLLAEQRECLAAVGS